MTFDHDATYDPGDDKLRIYPAYRLDKEGEYATVKAAGYRWAPKQECFFAVWSPRREDVALELAGEITDEQSSTLDRAEERSARFAVYQGKRQTEANAAYDTAQEIAQRFEGGQPILVGHHSEARARRDQKRIHNAMSKAVKLNDTASYWKWRAAAVKRHAAYREREDVRIRRIKKIRADRKRYVAAYTPASKEFLQKPWTCCADGCREMNARNGEMCKNGHLATAPIPHVLTGQGRAKHPTPVYRLREIERSYARSVAHCDHRLAYEIGMLGRDPADDPKPKRPAKPPLWNYRAPNGITVQNYFHKGETITYPQREMTKAELRAIYKDNKGTRVSEDGAHRVRIVIIRRDWFVVFLTDSKVHANPQEVPSKESADDPLPAADEPVNATQLDLFQGGGSYG